MKHAYIRPVYKENSAGDVLNYRPESNLSNLSKIYVKCLLNEIATYCDNILT